MLHRIIVASGGGPPIGCPRITTVSPEVTFESKVLHREKLLSHLQKYLTLYDILNRNIYYAMVNIFHRTFPSSNKLLAKYLTQVR